MTFEQAGQAAVNMLPGRLEGRRPFCRNSLHFAGWSFRAGVLRRAQTAVFGQVDALTFDKRRLVYTVHSSSIQHDGFAQFSCNLLDATGVACTQPKMNRGHADEAAGPASGSRRPELAGRL